MQDGIIAGMSLIEQDNASRVRAKGGLVERLKSLNERHYRIINKMVYSKMTADQVALELRVKAAWVRALVQDPLFRAEFDRTLQAKRDAMKPAALDRQGELVNSEDEHIALGATKAILSDGKGSGVSVNVGIQNTVNQTTNVAGYVVRLPAKAEPVTIEGKAE